MKIDKKIDYKEEYFNFPKLENQDGCRKFRKMAYCKKHLCVRKANNYKWFYFFIKEF